MYFNFQLINNALLKETKKEQLIAMLEGANLRSAWDKAKGVYALELIEEVQEDDLDNLKLLKRAMLNGASDWNEFSWGGCSLIYDRQIAERVCTPSELKRTDNGRLRPNRHEEWLDTQARALYQAWMLVRDAFIILKDYEAREV